MPSPARLLPLLAVLLSGAAAYISQTPEPPGATIYDRHWPYLAPGGDSSSWRSWRPVWERHWYWRRQPRADLGQGQKQEQGQEPVESGQEQNQQQQGQGLDEDGDQTPLHSWPDFLETDVTDEGEADLISRQRRKHSRPQRWRMQRLCEERGECTCHSPKTHATFCCDCQWGSCFPAAASALLTDGRVRGMAQLTAGDRVLTVDASGSLVPTTVLGFLDRRPAAAGEYLHVQLVSGHLLRLSANHVTFARRRPEGLFASELRVGDELLTEAGNGTAAYSAVSNITYKIMAGAFVPLTEHGTLLVDGVLASNYASFPHRLSHALTTPLRLWPALLSEWLMVSEKNVLVGGLKGLGKLLMETPASGVLRLTSL
ncbi:desert hedgehog protein-like [Amphibalanus amphitrite]|uniref:desert hedgehog protein-like n=1 Tax=Amphibalanus amphitrite TaxID=1232801 RepID=UPI001C90596A|nr:desert hedgehog protein-like [Amphibalanus amphitrite]